MSRFIAIVCALTTAACTSVTVQPVRSSVDILHVCIQANPQVQVEDFVPVIQERLQYHGIGSEIFSGRVPRRCEYVLTYTALRSWDMSAYLSHAELNLQKHGERVAYAEYHLKGKGGFSLMKWGDTKSKMDRVIDELLGT